MKEMLLNRLHEIEKEKDVKILLASESGSRSWGFASKDSDYDVRFIYVNKLPWYLSVTDRRDVIESMSENKLFDYAGWDIAKALNLFRSTNPTMLEWLHSPFVYYRDEEFASRLGAMEEQYLNPKKALHHYFGMSQNCYKSMGRERDFKMKPFLYHLRGLLACRWIETFAAAPPVPFAELVAATIKEEDVRSEISMLVALKAESNEYNAMPKLPDDLTVFLVDINGLKRTNDTLGHDAGDELIRGSAECIEKVFDNYGSVYRIGGDEFVVFAKMNRAQAETMIPKLNEKAAAWKGREVKSISLSSGFAVASEFPELNCEQLAAKADEEMYKAKEEYYRVNGLKRRV